MSGNAAIRIAAKMMYERLKVARDYQRCLMECGEESVEISTKATFTQADKEALEAYQSALNEINGAVPLPLGYSI